MKKIETTIKEVIAAMIFVVTICSIIFTVMLLTHTIGGTVTTEDIVTVYIMIGTNAFLLAMARNAVKNAVKSDEITAIHAHCF